MTIEAIKQAIEQHGPLTSKRMGELIKLSPSAISRYVLILKDAKAIHINEYKMRVGGRGRHPPVYALGDCPDASTLPRAKKSRKQHQVPRSAASRIQKTQAAGMWGGLMR